MTDKLSLYNSAKEAYYNGNPIMEDFEFDALEKELGLENKSYVGTRHNPSYTVKHPYIMGSLSKVQIHNTDNWVEYYNAAKKYINDYPVIVTPKYDGCSFEVFVENGNIKSISSRGDGNWGKDLSAHLISKVKRNLINEDTYTLRGEVLIDKTTFADKYSEFVNPRSFVAGVLGRDYDPCDSEFLAMINDLSIVIYDIRIKINTEWCDHDWDSFNLPDAPNFYREYNRGLSLNDFKSIYNDFSTYRETCMFALDGIVIKPLDVHRINNVTETRPKDCVAIKFMPMLEETEIVDIQWKLGKTGEYAPVVITNPVIMDGKSITRASGHNYGYLLDNKLSIGSKIVLSLAGDIIPFIYKVTNTDAFDNSKMNLPENTYVEGCHLMGCLDEDEIARLSFVNSAGTINIPNLGNAETLNIWNYISKNNGETDEFFEEIPVTKLPNNILLISPDDVYFGISSATKNGATGKAKKIQKAFKEVIASLTLKDIIKSCNYRFCGDKVAEQCANYLLGLQYSFEHLPQQGYEWCMSDSDKLNNVINIMKVLGKTYDDFKSYQIEDNSNAANQIPVILTGEPNDYKTKGEFLACHPEYRMTTSWKEVQIVFTNDINSNTGKMKKARDKNIEIRVY